MQKQPFLTLAIFFIVFSLSAQTLPPVKTVTIFKNGRSMIQRSGKVTVNDKTSKLTTLPPALFGTFWVSGPDLESVFSIQDSVSYDIALPNRYEMLKANTGKPMRIYLANGQNPPLEVEATCEKVSERSPETGEYIAFFKTKDGRWSMVNVYDIVRMEFTDKPKFEMTRKKPEKRLELRFAQPKSDAPVELSYLAANLGWTPVYRLELTDKTKGRLALRAEIINDAEDIGNAELRLAVGVPNFMYAHNMSQLVSFDNFRPLTYGSGNNLSNQSQSYQIAFDPETYEERVIPVAGETFEGSQAEDFYFYTVRPGALPEHSRYQAPIFETEVQPTHYYECILNAARPGADPYYYQGKNNKGDDHLPVTHYISFKNTTKYPWTTGAVNLLSQSGTALQPVSQDMLPYTAPGATCKVKIAQSPEINVTHAEGDVDRQENVKKFFRNTYDKVKIEAQICVINYKNEPVTLKVKRQIEGQPLQSEQPWNNTQEQATLRVNPSYILEWTIELKPGEERKWTYSYEVFVNM